MGVHGAAHVNGEQEKVETSLITVGIRMLDLIAVCFALAEVSRPGAKGGIGWAHGVTSYKCSTSTSYV